MKHTFSKVFLIILDGFGLAPSSDKNPVTVAGMPYLDSLVSRYRSYSVEAAGLVVGLPWGKPGNSEVGHSAIGTGRIVVQDWAHVNADIESGEFFKNPAFMAAINHCREYKSQLHLVGCLSPGSIHAHEDHLMALLDLAARENFGPVFVHMISDGEDSLPTESLATLKRLEPFLAKSHAKIASVMGRMYGMDRIFNWELTELAWNAMRKGEGEMITDVASYLASCHAKKIFDDRIPPAVVVEGGVPVGAIGDFDSIIFFNYRNDRMKQLVAPYVKTDFQGFERNLPKNLFVVTMTRYANDLPVSAVAYEPPDIHNTLGKVVASHNLLQFRIAEQEKSAHISNFMNGGRVDPYEGTEQIIVASRALKGDEYLAHPGMSAASIVAELLIRIPKKFSLYIANFANPDMMAHTGNLDATVAGLRVVDDALREIGEAVLAHKDYALVITCDHGNCEEVFDPKTGEPDTQHSTANVIAVFAGDGLESAEPEKNLETLADEPASGSLFDIAPSVLAMLSLDKPDDMTGVPLA